MAPPWRFPPLVHRPADQASASHCGVRHPQLHADPFAEGHETEEFCELVRRQAGHGGSSAPRLLTSRCYAAGSIAASPGPLPCPCEQPATARWGGTQASRRLAQGADRQPHSPRCLEGHHPSGSQRVHLLGRGRQAGDDPPTAHSQDRGGAGGRPASALLLARVCAPGAYRQIAVSSVPGSPARQPG